MNFCWDVISGQEGFDCLEQILKLDLQVIVLFMIVYVDIDKVVWVIKVGVIDFIFKFWEKEKLFVMFLLVIKFCDFCKEVR